jgi:hypothetical protein
VFSATCCLQEREAVEGSDRSRVQALEAQTQKLATELEDCKREHDLRAVECDTLRHDLKAVVQRLEASREIQAKLEMETHQQADELDIAKDKVRRECWCRKPPFTFAMRDKCGTKVHWTQR